MKARAIRQTTGKIITKYLSGEFSNISGISDGIEFLDKLNHCNVNIHTLHFDHIFSDERGYLFLQLFKEN